MSSFLTAFRQTATLPDASGRYRSSILLASHAGGEWSPDAIADFLKREGKRLPTVSLRLPVDEFDRLAADSSLRFGYVDAAGDTSSPLVPSPWVS